MDIDDLIFGDYPGPSQSTRLGNNKWTAPSI